jgi:hypothetical protein
MKLDLKLLQIIWEYKKYFIHLRLYNIKIKKICQRLKLNCPRIPGYGLPRIPNSL